MVMDYLNDDNVIKHCRRFKNVIENKIDDNVKEYLLKRFKDSESIKESIYRIENKLEQRPVCKECGGHVGFCSVNAGFSNFCSISCSRKNKETQEKYKQTCLKKYGYESSSASPLVKAKVEKTSLERYGTKNVWQSDYAKNKSKETCLKKFGYAYASSSPQFKENLKNILLDKYGVDNVFKYEPIKEKIAQTNLERYGAENVFSSPVIQERMKETWMENWGAEHPMKSEIFKEYYKECIKNKFGVENVFSIPEIREKIKQTRTKNGTWQYSRLEENMYVELLKRFNIVKREYKSTRYPFHCDFYIEDIDTFIEIQGTWLHGYHPYNPNSKEDIEQLKFLKEKAKEHTYYQCAIQVWTIGDVKKRNLAKENKLNYVELWNENDIKEWLSKYPIRTDIK